MPRGQHALYQRLGYSITAQIGTIPLQVNTKHQVPKTKNSTNTRVTPEMQYSPEKYWTKKRIAKTLSQINRKGLLGQ